MWIGNAPIKSPDTVAVQAFGAIGTNGLPLLLSWIAHEPHPTPVKKAGKSLLTKIPTGITPDIIVRWADDRPESERGSTAAYAIHLLGAQAEPAIPGLCKLMSAPYKGDVSMRATIALAQMGPVVLPIFLTNLTNPRVPRGTIAFFIGLEPALALATNAALAVRPLALRLQDNDPTVQAGAAFSLGVIRLDPDVAVPALVSCLDASPQTRVRQNAVTALQIFRSAARPAQTTLVRLLVDADGEVRIGATNALMAIAPEVITNAPAATTQ
jgi:HEAT repeat protein